MKTLKETREATGLSRSRFAELIGMPAQQLRTYEVGLRRPMPKSVERISAALEVEPEEIAEFSHLFEQERAERETRERVEAYRARCEREKAKV